MSKPNRFSFELLCRESIIVMRNHFLSECPPLSRHSTLVLVTTSAARFSETLLFVHTHRCSISCNYTLFHNMDLILSST